MILKKSTQRSQRRDLIVPLVKCQTIHEQPLITFGITKLRQHPLLNFGTTSSSCFLDLFNYPTAKIHPE